MALARAAVAIGVALLAALAVYLFVVRASGHEYTLIFENAGQLVKGDNVQIGGRAVGTRGRDRAHRRTTRRRSGSRSRSPTRRCARARRRSSGSRRCRASRTATSRSRPARTRASTLRRRRDARHRPTTTAVDLDQLFNTLDPEARRDLQGVIEGFRTQLEGKGDAGRGGDGVLQPAALQRPPAGQRDHAGRGRADRLHRLLLAHGDGDRRAPRRPRRARRQREHDDGRDRGREPRAVARRSRCCRRRCGAATRRS